MSYPFSAFLRRPVAHGLILGLLLFLSSICLAQAAEVTLAWDANDPVPDGYRIYQRTDDAAYDYSQPAWTGTETSGTVTDLADSTTYYFVVRAYSGSLESADSEEVAYTTPAATSTPATATPTTYSITASASALGTISPSGTVSVSEGDAQTFTISPTTGYHVAGVIVDGVSQGALTSYTFNNVTADHTISATFTADTYTITASAGTGGSISPSGSVSVSYGGSQTFTVTAASGYQVLSLLVDGVSQGALTSYTFNNIAASHTISATFAMNTYTVTASATEGGSISPSGQITVENGDSLDFSITANEGYEIVDLLVNGTSVGAQTRYTLADIAADSTVEAVFDLENQAPAADAGPDQTVDEEQTVTLSGLNSVDLDDGIASFQWRQIQGPEVALKNADEAEATFTAPDVDTSGASLVFELTVTDYSGSSSVDTSIVNVTWVNVPPTADAGDGATVAEGDDVVLDASGSTDPDDGIESYTWKQVQGPTVALSNDQSASASFTAPTLSTDSASLTFEVTVTDAGGLQDTDTVIVVVEHTNQAPLADAGSDQEVNAGDKVTLDGTLSTDTDGEIVAYHWSQTEGTPVTLSDATAEAPTFSAPDAGEDGTTLIFELTVTDDGGLKAQDSVQVVVVPTVTDGITDVTAPVLKISSPSRKYDLSRETTIDFSGTAVDETEVAQVSWKSSTGNSGIAVGTTDWHIDDIRLNIGFNVITVTATDTAGNASSEVRYVLRK